MFVLLSVFILMLASSLLMIAYVSFRDSKHKKSLPAEVTGAENVFNSAESLVTDYPDLIQKTA